MGSEAASALVSVGFRCSGNSAGALRPWCTVDAGALATASPWRTFRWYKGQKHYSGSFWLATENDVAIYESRLELARLLFADFDVSVRHIVAQPFLLQAEVDGDLRRHIPDYLLFTDGGPVVVDVKPRHRVDRPETAFTFAWTRRAVESRGWRNEVWSEPCPTELENVRFLAGYRRGWLFDQGVLEQLRAIDWLIDTKHLHGRAIYVPLVNNLDGRVLTRDRAHNIAVVFDRDVNPRRAGLPTGVIRA